MFFFILASFQIGAAERFNIAISASPNNLNPFQSTDANSQNINRLVHMSLIDFDDKMQNRCRACLSFQEIIENKKQVVKFKLRDDLTFSDGTKVKSNDVKKSWEYFALNDKIKSTHADTFESIERIDIKNDAEFSIVYKKFSIENLSNLSLLKIVKILNPNLEKLEPTDILGCGDYLLSKISPLEIVLEPKDKSKPSFNFKVVKDETTLALKLINHEIDLSVASISPRKTFWLKSKDNVLKVWDIPGANYQFMGLNHKREIFQDLRIRKAISLLIPRLDILKYKLKNTAILSIGMFSPAFADLYEPRPIEAYDVNAARKLLAEAGYVKNKNGLLEKNGKVFEIDWKVSNNKSSIEIVQVIQNFLEKEGFKINMSIQEWGTYMSSFKAGKFDIVVGQWVGFTGPDMLNFVFHSKNTPPKGGNRTSYNNPEFDRLAELASGELNEQKRNDYYKQALKVVNDDYAYINLWHPNIIWIADKCITNINLEPTGGFYPLLKIARNHEGECVRKSK